MISGLEAAQHIINHEAFFEALDEDGSHTLYAHAIARTGRFLSKQAGIAQGKPLA